MVVNIYFTATLAIRGVVRTLDLVSLELDRAESSGRDDAGLDWRFILCDQSF